MLSANRISRHGKKLENLSVGTSWCRPGTGLRVEGREQVLPGLGGIRVHDHWAPYIQGPEGLRVLCKVHHLEKLEELEKTDGEVWSSGCSVGCGCPGGAGGRAHHEGLPTDRRV